MHSKLKHSAPHLQMVWEMQSQLSWSILSLSLSVTSRKMPAAGSRCSLRRAHSSALSQTSRGFSVWARPFLITPEWSEQLLLFYICMSIIQTQCEVNRQICEMVYFPFYPVHSSEANIYNICITTFGSHDCLQVSTAWTGHTRHPLTHPHLQVLEIGWISFTIFCDWFIQKPPFLVWLYWHCSGI